MTKVMGQLYRDLDENMENQPRQKALNKIILSYVRGRRVLDVGCGSGTLLELLLKAGFESEGCDPSVSQCNLAKERLKKAKLSDINVYNTALDAFSPKNGKYNTVICLDVIEHLKNDKKAMAKLLSLIERDGRLLLVVPAMPSLWSKRDEEYGHHRRYTRQLLQKLLLNQPAKIKILRYWNFVGALFLWFFRGIHRELKTDYLMIEEKEPLKTINQLLYFWLASIESRIAFPFGLSLFLVAERSES